MAGSAVESTLGWLGYSPDQAKSALEGIIGGPTARTQLDELRASIDAINNSPKVRSGEIERIELNKEQLDNLAQTLNEYTAAGTGGFVPDLIVLMGMSGALSGVGLTKYINQLSKAFFRMIKVNSCFLES